MNWKRILIGNWSWKRPFISLASIYILLSLTACFMADRIIFVPPQSSYEASYPGLRHTKTTHGESIAYVHLPAAKGMPTLLYSHGNAEDLAQSDVLYEDLNGRGLGVIAYDYPGYGLATGTPDEQSCQRAIQACWDHLISSGIPASSIIIVGRSVGSGPSVWLASHETPAGLALISPFRSAFTAAIPTPFSPFPGDKFPNMSRIRSMRHPLLVIHGEEDNVIRVSHGKELFAASPATDKTLKLIPNAGHNDLFNIAGEEIVILLDDFAKQVAR